MTTNTIHITITPKGQLYEARLSGDILTTSRTPFLSSARVLQERGHAPDTVLIMSHAGEEIIALRGSIGAAAQLAVVENAGTGPKFGRYRDPSAAMAFAEVRECARTGGKSVSARVAREAIGAAL